MGLANYQLNEVVNISLITQYDKVRPDPLSVSLMVTGALRNWITFGALLGDRFGEFHVGLNAVISNRRWQTFVAFDNIIAGINPISSSNYQVRLGLNVRFSQASSD